MAYICDPKPSLLTSIAGVSSWVTYRPRAIPYHQLGYSTYGKGCPIVVEFGINFTIAEECLGYHMPLPIYLSIK